MAPAHRGALESLGIIGDKLIPRKENLCITAVVLGIAPLRRTLTTISHKAKLTKLVVEALHGLVLKAMILKKPKNTTVNSTVLIA
jgi:hypothetical protein